MSALGIRLVGTSLPLRSFPAVRQAAASTSAQSRSFCNFASTSLRPKHPKSSLQSRHVLLRSLSSESPAPTRHALGRITPKRIAVRAPRSQFRSSSSAEFDPDLPEKTIWRPIIFCILLGGGTFMGAAFLTNANAVFWRERIKSAAGVVGRLKTPSDRDLARARTMNDLQHAQAQMSSWQKSLNGYVPAFILTPVLRLKVAYENWRLNTPPGQVASMKVISVMGTVFLMWRLPRIRRTMDKWFLHRPVVFGLAKLHPWKQCVTLFTSTISHTSLTHFGFNALALFSFGSAAYAYISVPVAGGPRLSTVDNTPHFYAFLLCAGLFASLSSHLYTNLVKVPRLLKTLRNPARLSSAQALAAHHSILPSLGSSGAIYSALALTACALPDTEVSLIFLPFFAIPIGYGFGGLVLFDLIGLVKGWRALDHVAHLGGALFGVLYWMFGRQAWQNARLASAPAVEQAAVETYKNWDQKRK